MAIMNVGDITKALSGAAATDLARARRQAEQQLNAANAAGGTSATGIKGGSGSGTKNSTTNNNYAKFIYAGNSATPFLDNYKTQAAKQKENLNTRLSQLSSSRDAWLKEQQGIYDAYLKQMASDQATALNKSNTEYDNAATQNYLNYMNAQKGLAGQLNALGIRGGASESSALRLGTNYGTNVANNEAARNSALAALRQEYAQQLADYNKEYRNLVSNYNDTYDQRVAGYQDNYQTALDSLYATAQENQLKWEQSQLEKDLSQFSSAIKGQFNTEKEWKALIEELKKSKDPNRAAKIMLTRQAMNEWLEKQEEKKSSSSGGGGGGGYSRRSYGGYSNNNNNNSNNTNVSTTSEARINQAENKQRTSTVGRSWGDGSTKNATTKKKLVYGDSFLGGLYTY